MLQDQQGEWQRGVCCGERVQRAALHWAMQTLSQPLRPSASRSPEYTANAATVLTSLFLLLPLLLNFFPLHTPPATSTQAMINKAVQLLAADPLLSNRGLAITAADPGWCRCARGASPAAGPPQQSFDRLFSLRKQRHAKGHTMCPGGVTRHSLPSWKFQRVRARPAHHDPASPPGTLAAWCAGLPWAAQMPRGHKSKGRSPSFGPCCTRAQTRRGGCLRTGGASSGRDMLHFAAICEHALCLLQTYACSAIRYASAVFSFSSLDCPVCPFCLHILFAANHCCWCGRVAVWHVFPPYTGVCGGRVARWDMQRLRPHITVTENSCHEAASNLAVLVPFAS